MSNHLSLQCQETLIQLSDFFLRHLKPKEYNAMVPDLTTLHADFNLEANALFHLTRPKLKHDIALHEDAKKDAADKNGA